MPMVGRLGVHLQYGTCVVKTGKFQSGSKFLLMSNQLATRIAKFATDELANAPQNKYYETRRLWDEMARKHKQDLEKLVKCWMGAT